MTILLLKLLKQRSEATLNNSHASDSLDILNCLIKYVYILTFFFVHFIDPKSHIDVMTWKYFPHYRLFVKETAGHLCIPLTKGQCCRALMFPLLFCVKELLNKQSSYLWFEKPWCSFDVNVSYLLIFSWKWMSDISNQAYWWSGTSRCPHY